MSASRLKVNASLQEQMSRCERLCFDLSIVHNATPASKTHSSDIGSIALLRAEGQTAAVDAVETLTWTTAVDNSTGASNFGIYLQIGSTVTPALGPVASSNGFADKVYNVTVTDSAGKTLVATGPNAVKGGFLSPLGNIAIEIASSDLNLASTDDTLHIVVDYREAKA